MNDNIEALSAAKWKAEADMVYKGLLAIEAKAEIGSDMYYELFETFAQEKGLY